jgi:dTDP-4-dehydrorhamnose 3,5-epimerase-like enzyme
MDAASKIQISDLTNHGDQRGFSFTIPPDALSFLEHVQDIHVAAILPSAVRGNHFHKRRREILVLTYTADWSFHWDEGPGTAVQERTFEGRGAVLITISPGASHAVRNDGYEPLTLMAASSEPYDPKDSIARRVI